jgi:hypothetical protein
MRGEIYADFSRFDREGVVAISNFPDKKKDFKYFELFPSALPRQIIYVWFNQVLVTTSGSVLVRQDSFSATCHEGVPERIANSPLLLHQLCRLQQINQH